MFNLANILTLSRIFVIPFVIYSYEKNLFVLAAVLALWGGVSDFLDGYVARKFNQTSPLGSLLDPVADKFFEMGICGYFLVINQLPEYYVYLLFFRNTAQLMAIPILGWAMKIPFKVSPKLPSKWGSAMGFIIISIIILKTLVGSSLESIFTGLLTLVVPISAGFEVYILLTYVPRFIQIANGTHDTFE